MGDASPSRAAGKLGPVLKDVVEAKPLKGHRMYIRFEDGIAGEIDVGEIVDFEGIFAPLKDEETFKSLSVNSELGTVTWPNGADLDPQVLYSKLTDQ